MIIESYKQPIVYFYVCRGKGHFYEAPRDFLPYQRSLLFLSLGVVHFTNSLSDFPAFIRPEAAALRRKHASVLGDLFSSSGKMKSNYFLWALSSGISCSERNSCCSQVFSSPICFVIFSLSPPTAAHPIDLNHQITAHQKRMWSVSEWKEMNCWRRIFLQLCLFLIYSTYSHFLTSNFLILLH